MTDLLIRHHPKSPVFTVQGRYRVDKPDQLITQKSDKVGLEECVPWDTKMRRSGMKKVRVLVTETQMRDVWIKATSDQVKLLKSHNMSDASVAARSEAIGDLVSIAFDALKDMPPTSTDISLFDEDGNCLGWFDE